MKSSFDSIFDQVGKKDFPDILEHAKLSIIAQEGLTKQLIESILKYSIIRIKAVPEDRAAIVFYGYCLFYSGRLAEGKEIFDFATTDSSCALLGYYFLILLCLVNDVSATHYIQKLKSTLPGDDNNVDDLDKKIETLDAFIRTFNCDSQIVKRGHMIIVHDLATGEGRGYSIAGYD